MAITGDLENLHIADIIQLIHTTRQSGTFSASGERGKSRIVFGNGHIVGASHLDNRVRIGTVLVRMNLLSVDDLRSALASQKTAGSGRKPLLATLMHAGKLTREGAFKGLKKLVEIAVVELIGWKKGSFTFDTEEIAVSPDCSYSPGAMDQELSLDAQMILMDAMRIYDEQERDRMAGKDVPANEDLFADVLPGEETVAASVRAPVITEDLLGLADLDRLEKKIPEPVSFEEIFDPFEIHRKTLKQMLADFPADEQDRFISYVRRSILAGSSAEATLRREGAPSVIFVGCDPLVSYAIMTILKSDGMFVFAVEGHAELDRTIEQCLQSRMMPMVVFDVPGESGSNHSLDTADLRQAVRTRYSQASMVQLALPGDFTSAVQPFLDGVDTVFPRPSRRDSGADYVADLIVFCDAFRVALRRIGGGSASSASAQVFGKMQDRIASMRIMESPEQISRSLLQDVAGYWSRAVLFAVQAESLVAGEAIGLRDEKDRKPGHAPAISIPLSSYSVFRDLVDEGKPFLGDVDDDLLRTALISKIGDPADSVVLLLPLKSSGRVVSLIYADSGRTGVQHPDIGLFGLMAQQAGMALDLAVYRLHLLNAGRTK